MSLLHVTPKEKVQDKISDPTYDISQLNVDSSKKYDENPEYSYSILSNKKKVLKKIESRQISWKSIIGNNNLLNQMHNIGELSLSNFIKDNFEKIIGDGTNNSTRPDVKKIYKLTTPYEMKTYSPESNNKSKPKLQNLHGVVKLFYFLIASGTLNPKLILGGHGNIDDEKIKEFLHLRKRMKEIPEKQL